MLPAHRDGRNLLAQVGISFEIVKAEGEEIINTTVPEEAVKELSRQKAREVAARTDGDVVIGADTVVAADHEILGKPKDQEDAVRMIRMLQGRTHQVLTGVTVILRDGVRKKEICFAETTHVHVYPMTEEQIRDYVASGEPMVRPVLTASRDCLRLMYPALKVIIIMVVGAPGRAALPGGAGSRHRS